MCKIKGKAGLEEEHLGDQLDREREAVGEKKTIQSLSPHCRNRKILL